MTHELNKTVIFSNGFRLGPVINTTFLASSLAPKWLELVDQVVVHFRRQLGEQDVADEVLADHGHASGRQPDKVDHGSGLLVKLYDDVRGTGGLLVRRLFVDDDAALAAMQQPAEGFSARRRRVEDGANPFEGSGVMVLKEVLAPAKGGGGELLLLQAGILRK